MFLVLRECYHGYYSIKKRIFEHINELSFVIFVKGCVMIVITIDKSIFASFICLFVCLFVVLFCFVLFFEIQMFTVIIRIWCENEKCIQMSTNKPNCSVKLQHSSMP